MNSASSRRSPPLDASNPDSKSLSWSDEQEAAGVVEACKKGDSVAQRRLYEVSQQNVYRLIVRMVGVQDATDVTQQAFLQAFRKIGQFSGRSQIGTWLYRIAVNEALQHLRRSKRSRVQVLELEPIDGSPDRNKNFDDKELLEKALGLVEPDLRSTFLLREVEELSYGAIAEVLGIPEGTVGSRLNRARRELKLHLVQLGWEP